MSWLNKLGFGARSPTGSPVGPSSSIAREPDEDVPDPAVRPIRGGLFLGRRIGLSEGAGRHRHRSRLQPGLFAQSLVREAEICMLPGLAERWRTRSAERAATPQLSTAR